MIGIFSFQFLSSNECVLCKLGRLTSEVFSPDFKCYRSMSSFGTKNSSHSWPA